MKSKALVSLFLFILLAPLIAQGSSITFTNPLAANTLEELVENLSNFIFWIALALAPLMVLIGAFFLMSSGGDINKIEIGKKIILYTAIGFFIVLSARGIVAILRMILGV